jgi:hypothetical protein
MVVMEDMLAMANTEVNRIRINEKSRVTPGNMSTIIIKAQDKTTLQEK